MTIVYLINRSPLVPLKGYVPERVWLGRNVSYQHLRVFRCLVYMHVANDQRSKLDSKSKPCIFLGNSEDEFGYRLWDLLDKKVVPSRDIVFMEENTIEDWKQQKPVSSSQPAVIVMESALVDPSSTQPVGRQQSANETEFEPASRQ